jgi:hypothetical protein
MEHQVPLNAFAYVPEYGQFDCGFSHLGVSKYSYISIFKYMLQCGDIIVVDCEVFRCGKVHYSNSNVIINFV